MEVIFLIKKTVQVFLSTYNGAQYIEEQIESIVNQKGISVKILIRDDGSTDGTLIKLNKLMSKYPSQITILAEHNVGVVRSFFNIIQQSSEIADYYAFCDQDDVWLPYKLLKAVNQLQVSKNGTPLLYCTATQMVSQDLKPIKIWPRDLNKKPTFKNALIENVCVGCTMVFNYEALKLIKDNLPNNIENIIMHDWWTYLLISAIGEVYFDSKPSILYRQHDNNVLGGEAKNLLYKWYNRFQRYRHSSVNNKNRITRQIYEFYSCFNNKLSPYHREMIESILSGMNKNVLTRFIRILKSPIYRQSLIDDILIKLMYVLKKM